MRIDFLLFLCSWTVGGGAHATRRGWHRPGADRLLSGDRVATSRSSATKGPVGRDAGDDGVDGLFRERVRQTLEARLARAADDHRDGTTIVERRPRLSRARPVALGGGSRRGRPRGGERR